MKKIIILALTAMFTSTILMSCEKEKVKSMQQPLSMYSFDDIDLITQEMSIFHADYMTYFLNSIYPNIEKFDSTSYDIIRESIYNKMLGYTFQYCSMSDSLCYLAISNIPLSLYYNIINFSQSSYDFSLLNEIESLKDVIVTLNTDALSDFFVSVDSIIPSFIDNSDSFDDFKDTYHKYVQQNLFAMKNIQTKEEYFYAKLFSEMYLSSIYYLSSYLCGQDKGPRWEKFKGMVKEAWEITRPIVASDAGGAVVGAMAGAVTGPGIVATGMAGACGASAGYCVEQLINGI
ncbi:MAG: glycine zipper family protein [Candidatus Saccharibacteria bacterium]|nr:glycine zipper family protein [Candidatus Saccharibacteria bacterium]